MFRKMRSINPLRLSFSIILWCCFTQVLSQEFYTARGYWEESTKAIYRNIKEKEFRGDSLSKDEMTYLLDYEIYLSSYYQKLSEAEKARYAQMKDTWDRALAVRTDEVKPEFEWRNRDRAANAFFGIYYGASLVALAEIDNAAAAGLPLITGGLWLLGPAVNTKKYEGITQATIRASNTGKLLGLVYGGSLGMAVNAEDKVVFFLSSIGSIALGETGFQIQKKKNLSEGYVELIRHYGFLGPWTAIAANIALTNEQSTSSIGFTILAGGAAGLVIGNKVGSRYAYTRGDVDAIGTLALVSTGIGFTMVAESLDDQRSDALIMLPALGTIAGTYLGQRMVKGIYLTNKQGSLINLATGGSALIGFGLMTLVESESVAAWIGVPSVLGLLAHQIAFSSFKKENLLKGIRGYRKERSPFRLSMNVSPENYFINQKMSGRETSFSGSSLSSNPIVLVKLRL